jgi:hypothetical protein
MEEGLGIGLGMTRKLTVANRTGSVLVRAQARPRAAKSCADTRVLHLHMVSGSELRLLSLEMYSYRYSADTNRGRAVEARPLESTSV